MRTNYKVNRVQKLRLGKSWQEDMGVYLIIFILDFFILKLLLLNFKKC